MKIGKIFAAAFIAFALPSVAASAQEPAGAPWRRGPRPADFERLQWMNGAGSDSSEIAEAHINDGVVIRIEASGLPEGAPVDVEVWGITGNGSMDFMGKAQGTASGGAAEIEWVVELELDSAGANYAREIKDNGYTIVDFVFRANLRGKYFESAPLAILASALIMAVNQNTGEPIRGRNFLLFGPGRESISVASDGEGIVSVRNLREIGRLFIRAEGD